MFDGSIGCDGAGACFEGAWARSRCFTGPRSGSDVVRSRAWYAAGRCVHPGFGRAVVSELRALTGRNVFEAGNPAMAIVVPHSPHRVFISRLGRLEVFQPIPPPHGRSPDGPHTHVLPKLLKHARTHASTEQIPQGLVPCVHLYPAHPAKDAFGRPLAFDEQRHALFQSALQRFGDRDIVDLRECIHRAIEEGAGPSDVAIPDDRFARGSVRVTLRQLKASRRLARAIRLA